MATKLTINLTFPIFGYCKNKICIDVGANEGCMMIPMLESGALKIYAFEAGHNLCIGLKDRFKENEKVIIEEFAVSDEQTILENVTWINSWMLGTPEQMGLPVSPGACDIEGYKLVSIPTISLDYYFKDISEDIGMMKIDVDGYELKVLRGALNIIMKCRPIIMIELSFYIDKVPGSSVKDFMKLIKDIDYVFIAGDGKICDIDYINREFPWHSSCDVIIIPSEQMTNPDIIKNIHI